MPNNAKWVENSDSVLLTKILKLDVRTQYYNIPNLKIQVPACLQFVHPQLQWQHFVAVL